MALDKLHASTVAPSNVLKFRPRDSSDLCASYGTSQDICADDRTKQNAENDSENRVIPLPVSLIQEKEKVSCPDVSRVCAKAPGKLLTDKEFRELVEHLTAGELRRRFPLEENSHRDMNGRRLKDYKDAHIDPAFKSFKAFLLDVGQRPAADWTLDRIDRYRKEYGPGLCRWAKKRDQSNNRRCTIMLRDSDGTVRALAEWAGLTGQKPDTMRKNHHRRWSDPEIIAGRRFRAGEVKPVAITAAKPVAPAAPQAAWPTGAVVKVWEDAYRTFAAHFDAYAPSALPNLSRDAFFWWIARNLHAGLWQQLKARHRWCIDPQDDPPPDEVASDPQFIMASKCSIALREVGIRIAANPTASECVNGLQRIAAIADPADLRLPRLFVDHHARLAQARRRSERDWDGLDDERDDHDPCEEADDDGPSSAALAHVVGNGPVAPDPQYRL